MPQRTTPPGQLDIPLVWTSEPPQAAREAPDPPHEPAPRVRPARAPLRLWLGAIADAVVLAVAVGVFWGIAAAAGAALGPAQLALAAAAGLAAASVVALGCLWGWRGSPGMLLLGVCFARPIPFGRAWRIWVAWVPSLLLVGLPLVLRNRGGCVAERLAGGELSSRSSPGSA